MQYTAEIDELTEALRHRRIFLKKHEPKRDETIPPSSNNPTFQMLSRRDIPPAPAYNSVTISDGVGICCIERLFHEAANYIILISP